jgi:GNAT superfamily N-acetyltransferase
MEIRRATIGDYDAYASLFPELGVDDPLPSRERFADELVFRMTVATDEQRVVGYTLFEQLAETGYIRNIVTAPSARRRGVGRALMDDARSRFVAAGATSWCLNVKPGNVPAITLYERCGMSPAYRSCALRLPHEIALPAPHSEIMLADVPTASDPTLEPAFTLLRGQLASARAKTGRRVVQLARHDRVLGIGVFAPSIPGSFPFRLVDPSFAGAFLGLLRPLCPPESTFVQVGVEDDEPLRDAVLALGAYVQLEILHMRGQLR